MQTRARVQDAAQAQEGAHGQPRGALGRRYRRPARPLLPRTVGGETAGAAGDGGVVPLQGSGWRRVGAAKVWSGRGPHKGFLADTRRRHGRWVHGALQMPEALPEYLITG